MSIKVDMKRAYFTFLILPSSIKNLLYLYFLVISPFNPINLFAPHTIQVSCRLGGGEGDTQGYDRQTETHVQPSRRQYG